MFANPGMPPDYVGLWTGDGPSGPLTGLTTNQTFKFVHSQPGGQLAVQTGAVHSWECAGAPGAYRAILDYTIQHSNGTGAAGAGAVARAPPPPPPQQPRARARPCAACSDAALAVVPARCKRRRRRRPPPCPQWRAPTARASLALPATLRATPSGEAHRGLQVEPGARPPARSWQHLHCSAAGREATGAPAVPPPPTPLPRPILCRAHSTDGCPVAW